jgi:hypothetical protein
MLRGLCVDAGDVLVQAYIGPGRAGRTGENAVNRAATVLPPSFMAFTSA